MQTPNQNKPVDTKKKLHEDTVKKAAPSTTKPQEDKKTQQDKKRY